MRYPTWLVRRKFKKSSRPECPQCGTPLDNRGHCPQCGFCAG